MRSGSESFRDIINIENRKNKNIFDNQQKRRISSVDEDGIITYGKGKKF